jgi:hypothetical protein
LTTIVVQVNNMRGGLWDGGPHGRDIFELVAAQINPASWAKPVSMSHGRITP